MMKRTREQLNRLLDNELTEAERQALQERLRSDPLLERELRGLQQAVRRIESAERPSPPAAFTAEVMAKLPEMIPTSGERVRSFLFGERVLRWNMASAAAMAGIVLLLGVLLYRMLPTEPGALAVRAGAAVPVIFQLYAPEASRVAVAGEFNQWRFERTELKRLNGGRWVAEVPLEPGSYAYMFVVDGKVWTPDPEADAHRDDGFGYRNSVKRVYDL